MSIYCTYITFYRGNKLPPFYIGSTSVDKVNNGYHGSVGSKEYKTIYDYEIKNNPDLFRTKILSKHDTREQAFEKEHHFQKQLNVVTSSMYMNKAYACINGYFSIDITGEKNPNFNNRWSDEQREIASIRVTNYHIEHDSRWISHEESKKTKFVDKSLVQIFILDGWVEGRHFFDTNKISEHGRKNCDERNSVFASCLICQKSFQAHKLEEHIKRHTNGVEYFENNYVSFVDLREKQVVLIICITNIIVKDVVPKDS